MEADIEHGGGDDHDAETSLGGFTSTGTLMDSLMHVGSHAGTLSEPGHRHHVFFRLGGPAQAPIMHELDCLGGGEVQGPASLATPQGS